MNKNSSIEKMGVDFWRRRAMSWGPSMKTWIVRPCAEAVKLIGQVFVSAWSFRTLDRIMVFVLLITSAKVEHRDWNKELLEYIFQGFINPRQDSWLEIYLSATIKLIILDSEKVCSSVAHTMIFPVNRRGSLASNCYSCRILWTK